MHGLTREMATVNTEEFTTVDDDIERMFTYHPPKGTQTKRYEALREQGKKLAYAIAGMTPRSPEQEQALMFLNLAVMSANAAIARNE